MNQSSEDIIWKERNELDVNKWNRLVVESKEVSIYSYSWYLDAVSANWGALVKGDYEAVMPVPYVKKKGQYIVYQPFFSRELGVFGTISLEVEQAFFNAIPAKFKLIQFNFPINVGISDLKVESVVHQELDLSQAIEALRANYSTNGKRILKKATQQTLELKEIDDTEALVNLFKTTKGSEIGLTDENFEALQRLMTEGLRQNKAILLGAYWNNELLASGYFFVEEERITYLKGAVTGSGKKNGAMYVMMDHVIAKYAQQNKVLDFGGSKIESIASFYKKFGAKDRTYYSCTKNQLPWILKQGKALRDKLKK